MPRGIKVRFATPAQAASPIGIEVRRADHYKTQPIRRDQGLAAGVVERTLLTTVHTADGEPIRLVEERSRLVVLQRGHRRRARRRTRTVG